MESNINGQAVSRKRIWQHPWGYAESLMISFSWVVVGFLIQYFSGGKGLQFSGFPVNVIILALFVVYVILFHWLVKHPVKKWFSSVPAALSAIVAFAFLVLLMGFIPQGKGNNAFIMKTGLTNIVSSWAYFLSSMHLILVLSFTILKRIRTFSLRNVAFLLNHFGLWLVIVSASLGSGDMQKLRMYLKEGKTTHTAFGYDNIPVNLDFSLTLKNFSLEEFAPFLVVADRFTNEIKNKQQPMIEAVKGNQGIIGGWQVTIMDFIDNALEDTSGFRAVNIPGCGPAAYVSAVEIKSGTEHSGWVSVQSYFSPSRVLMLDSNHYLAMTVPRPKKYISEIVVVNHSGENREFTVEVNKPVSFEGWKIYQAGYNEKMGKWSDESLLELVKDPWLPVVYTGIFMLMAGAVYLFWMGRKQS